jgi:hypothetical protein
LGNCRIASLPALATLSCPGEPLPEARVLITLLSISVNRPIGAGVDERKLGEATGVAVTLEWNNVNVSG